MTGPADVTVVPPAGELAARPVAEPGGRPSARPADVAREALRSARREALRAEASEGGSRRRARGEARAAAPAPGHSGDEPRSARAQAAHEMRQFLTNAFRMPTWADTLDTTDGPDTQTPGTDTPGRDRPSTHTASMQTPSTDTPSLDTPSTHMASTDQPSADTASTHQASTDKLSTDNPSTDTASTHTPRPNASGPHAPGPHTPGRHALNRPTPDRHALASRTPGGDTSLTEPRPSLVPVPVPVSERAPVAARAPHGPAGPRTPAAAAPQIPASMGTPHRDTELRRTFTAFPPRAVCAEDSSFAETWWGNAWVDALEQGALDVKRLARGRGYADLGHVDAITVTPGLVLAYVRGSRPRPYRVQVRLRTLEDEDWERFLDAAADRPGHIAALLDKELPESLADCGVPLLPGPRDLAPQCSCPDSGHPCKHAAALCYQTARLLDADPFVLLLLRGRGEKELLDTLSRRSAARAARAAQERSPRALPGVRASEALAPRRLAPLPPPLPVPPHPGQPPVYPAAPGGPDPFALDQLATDAAARAHALLATGRDPVGELTLWQDAVRLAAARPGSGLTAATRALYSTLATAVGRTPADLARAVAAWRQGGPAGLEVLEEPWDPPAGRFDRARPLLLAADLPAFRPRRNRLTHPRGHVQLRLGRDGLWYAYESEPDHDDWWPRGTPDLDPVGALTGLGTPDDL
ncbi:SWIM zinc finger family protein [Streptomyces sp. NPDC007971]|uniref:SWIM zinc finger family protein n=1 Tax=Streptomyces sp. NPDC007971 TaxID=3364799 RepID=UPI0036ED3236